MDGIIIYLHYNKLPLKNAGGCCLVVRRMCFRRMCTGVRDSAPMIRVVENSVVTVSMIRDNMNAHLMYLCVFVVTNYLSICLSFILVFRNQPFGITCRRCSYLCIVVNFAVVTLRVHLCVCVRLLCIGILVSISVYFSLIVSAE